MTRSLLLADRLREVLLSGYWIANTNFHAQLLGVHWQQATQKIAGLNSVAALTFHINYYLRVLLKSFETGELLISDKFSFDMTPILSQNDWEQSVAEFVHNAEEFANRVEALDDGALDQPFIEQRYGTWLRNIEGVIEHSYYHLGQISLIRKMLTTN